MSRLLTVVNERQKLRSEYRHVLEQEYINEQKAKELEAQEAENLIRQENGEKVAPTPQQLKEMLLAKE